MDRLDRADVFIEGISSALLKVGLREGVCGVHEWIWRNW